MRRKRIYFFNRFFWPDNSATAQILTDLCRDLDTRKYTVTVVASRLNYGDASISYLPVEEFNGIRIIRLWSTRFGRGTLVGRLMDYLTIYLSIFLFLLREPRAEDVCVFKTDPPLLSIPGAIAKSVRGFGMIAWCQDIFPEVAISEIQPPTGTRWIFNALARARNWSLQCSERVVVLGNDMADFLKASGIGPHRLKTISNWSVQEDVSTNEDSMRREWEIPDGTFVVGYSGNLGRAHDWRTIADAADRLRETPNLLFLCCGGGHGYEQLRSAVSEMGLDSLFRFVPYQPIERLASTLRVPDVHWFTLKQNLSQFIFPSKFFGILQAGRPMLFVGSISGEIARLIGDNRIGHSVREGDPESLARNIRAMMSDPEGTRASGRLARALWESCYRKSVEIEKWDALLGVVTVQGRGP